MYDKYSVIYYREPSLASRTHRGSCRERLKDLTVINPVVNLAVIVCDSQFPGFLYHMLTQEGHTHTSLFLLKMA